MRIVSCGPHTELRTINLSAVLDGAVIKPADHMATLPDGLGHAQSAVEAARLQHGVLLVILDLVMNQIPGTCCGRSPEDPPPPAVLPAHDKTHHRGKKQATNEFKIPEKNNWSQHAKKKGAKSPASRYEEIKGGQVSR